MVTRESEVRLAAAKTRAEANFKKEERAVEGAKAMQEYQANGREVREQMARLRALRLAKEAEEKAKAALVQAAAKVNGKADAKSGAKIDAKTGVKPQSRAKKAAAE